MSSIATGVGTPVLSSFFQEKINRTVTALLQFPATPVGKLMVCEIGAPTAAPEARVVMCVAGAASVEPPMLVVVATGVYVVGATWIITPSQMVGSNSPATCQRRLKA